MARPTTAARLEAARAGTLDPSPARAASPRRRLGWLGVAIGALAGGLVAGATVAALGVDVLPSSGPRSVDAIGTVRRLGPVSPGPVTLRVTFTTNVGSSVPGFTNRVTYRAVGTAAATVDLSQVGSGDVQVRGGRARVRIPAPQLGAPIVDQSRSAILQHDPGILTDILGSGDVSTSDLQSAAATHLTEEAQAEGVPQAAQRVAEADIRAALRRIGITTVVVTLVAPS